MTTYLPVQIDNGNGDPIVLLHGLGNNYKSWSFVIDKLDYSKNRIIAVDLLGFGDAPKLRNIKYDPEDHSKAVIKTLDKLGLKKVLLAGHSMGSIIAIEVAKQRPDLVCQLILFGAPIYKSMPKHSTWWSHITRSEGTYYKIFSIVRDNPEAVKAGGEIADELVPFVKGIEITDETWPAYKKSLENTIMQFQTFKDICQFKIPTLFVNGIFDFFIIRKNTKEIARKNRQFVKVKTVLGPHELTPAQGKKVAKILQDS
jgi:pimeloyl-ACP methyl ester carboxylesterase